MYDILLHSIARLYNYLSDFLILISALLLKILCLNFEFKIDNTKSSQRIMAVLGNGPSLKTDLPVIYKRKDLMDFSVVNYFANTKYFCELKPIHYFLVDPVFWSSNVNININKDNDMLFDNLTKVDWPMVLYCGTDGYNFIKKRVNSNKFITVKSVNSSWVDLRSEKANIFALRYRLSTPNFVNVLIAALWYALMSGRKNIIIYGADFSSFQELKVDQKTNQALTASKHFYGDKLNSDSYVMKYLSAKPKMINVRFYQVWLAFRQMYYISKVATKWNVRIRNHSTFSFLDCFERL